jgi:hypothetical protein
LTPVVLDSGGADLRPTIPQFIDESCIGPRARQMMQADDSAATL